MTLLYHISRAKNCPLPFKLILLIFIISFPQKIFIQFCIMLSYYINMSAENIWRGIDKSSHVWRLSADSARIAQTCNSYLTFISYRWKLSESIPERFSYWDIFEYINIVHQWKQLHSLPSGFSIRRNKTGFQPQY